MVDAVLDGSWCSCMHPSDTDTQTSRGYWVHRRCGVIVRALLSDRLDMSDGLRPLCKVTLCQRSGQLIQIGHRPHSSAVAALRPRASTCG
jgi:hypothetical protein